MAGAAIAAVISIFDAINPLHAFGGATLAVVVIAKGRVLKSPQFLRSFTEAILGNKLRRGVSIAAVVLGLLVGTRQRSLQAQQEKQAQAQAAPNPDAQAASNPDAERAAREAERTAERARASFNAAVAEAEQQPDTPEGAASAVYSYRCASHFGVLDAAHASRFAQRLHTIALALLADKNYGTAISLLEEAKHESPTIDVDADLERARAAQNKPPGTRAPLRLRTSTPVEHSSSASSPVTPPLDAEMVMGPPDWQLRCRPKRKTE